MKKIATLVKDIVDLDNEIDALDAKKKDKRRKVLDLMTEEGATQVAVDVEGVGEVTVALVQPQSVKYDEDGLKTFFKERRLLKSVTKVVLDMGKVQALVKVGQVKADEVAKYATVEEGTAYIRINKPRKGGKK